MKLAEALLLRADIQKKLASVHARAQKYACVQQGEKPAENPMDLLRQADILSGEFAKLVAAINKANLSFKLKSGVTLTEALAKREALAQRRSIINSVAEASAKPPERYGMKEIRWVATVDASKLQKQSDALAKELRELNAAIQEAGWQAEVEL